MASPFSSADALDEETQRIAKRYVANAVSASLATERARAEEEKTEAMIDKFQETWNKWDDAKP